MSPEARVISPFPVRYMEYRPPVDLAAWVACFWHMHGEVAEGSTIAHRVLPDGCADLIFGPGSSTLVGPVAGAAVIELRGRVDLVGIRFRPGIVGAFSGIPADQLRAGWRDFAGCWHSTAARAAALETKATDGTTGRDWPSPPATAINRTWYAIYVTLRA